MKLIPALILSVFLVACATHAVPAAETSASAETVYPRDDHGEVLAFDDAIIDLGVVEDVIADAAEADKKALIVMGTNSCHDSRALATHFEKPRFKTMIDNGYVLKYVDVGWKNQNLHIANHFGLDGIKGTPTVVIVNGAGDVMNLEDAPTWRNAASRNEDDIFEYFQTHATR